MPRIVTTGPESPRPLREPSLPGEKTYFNSDSSGASTPVDEKPELMFVFLPPDSVKSTVSHAFGLLDQQSVVGLGPGYQSCPVSPLLLFDLVI